MDGDQQRLLATMPLHAITSTYGEEGLRARFAVAIRTAALDTSSGVATFGVGSGITWDADPGGEWDEMVAKAAVLGAGARPRAGAES